MIRRTKAPTNKWQSYISQKAEANDWPAIRVMYSVLEGPEESSFGEAISHCIQSIMTVAMNGKSINYMNIFSSVIEAFRGNTNLMEYVSQGIATSMISAEQIASDTYEYEIHHLIDLIAHEPELAAAAHTATASYLHVIHNNFIEYLDQLIITIRGCEPLLKHVSGSHLETFFRAAREHLLPDPLHANDLLHDIHLIEEISRESPYLTSVFGIVKPTWFLSSTPYDFRDEKTFIIIAALKTVELDDMLVPPDVKNHPSYPKELIWVTDTHSDFPDHAEVYTSKTVATAQNNASDREKLGVLFRMVERAITVNKEHPEHFTAASSTLTTIASVVLRHGGLAPQLPQDVQNIIARFAPSGAN